MRRTTEKPLEGQTWPAGRSFGGPGSRLGLEMSLFDLMRKRSRLSNDYILFEKFDVK